MKIKKIISQHRRDFRADMICEHCGHIEERKSGYDDSYFHQKVIPEMVCKKCHKKAPADYNPRPTKYADHEIV